MLANEIACIFPGESAHTYYVPFVQEGNLRSLASRKLWNHFNYLKDCLREADLLERRSEKTVSYETTESGNISFLK